MTPRLVALDEGPDISLDGMPIVVGRDPRCDVRLTCMRVSRRHCRIRLVDGEVQVCDLGSTNGILINGRQALSGRLHAGDTLSIAGLRFRLELVPPARRSWLIRRCGAGPPGEFPTRLDDGS